MDTEAIKAQIARFPVAFLVEREWKPETEANAKHIFQEIIKGVYEDAMERAIKAVKAKAIYTDRKGNEYAASIGHLEVEIAIRQELTEDAGGNIRVAKATDANQEGKQDENHIH